MIVGVIGGVAAGKSYVTTKLQEIAGAATIHADQLAHEVLNSADLQPRLIDLFGPRVISNEGVDRSVISQQVFGNAPDAVSKLRQLEQWIHPIVRQNAKNLIRNIQIETPERLILLDIPLLLESHWHDECERILFIDTPDTLREQIAAKRGWTRQQWIDREKAQLPIAAKRAAATDVLKNDGTLEELDRQIAALWTSWQTHQRESI